jgi:predicted pyridoxine 5'-phosphate oxidase superfamily flavin-nucleotide-binding protein
MATDQPGGTGILTEGMRQVVREQRPGFVATVCPDGTPNLSPKGATAVWDDEHLVFADLRSPRTVANLRTNPAVEVNVVDPIARRGYRFKGAATVLTDGALFDEIMAFYERGEAPVRDARSRIRHIVMVKVERAFPLVSPAYDLGLTEEAVRATWWGHFHSPQHPSRMSHRRKEDPWPTSRP